MEKGRIKSQLFKYAKRWFEIVSLMMKKPWRIPQYKISQTKNKETGNWK